MTVRIVVDCALIVVLLAATAVKIVYLIKIYRLKMRIWQSSVAAKEPKA